MVVVVAAAVVVVVVGSRRRSSSSSSSSSSRRTHTFGNATTITHMGGPRAVFASPLDLEGAMKSQRLQCFYNGESNGKC